MPRRVRPTPITLQGRGAAPGLACGPLLPPTCDVAGAADGVLVTPRATPETLERSLAAAATIALGGAVLAHASLLCRERGRPLIVFGEAHRLTLLDPVRDGALLGLGDVVSAGRQPPWLTVGDVVVVDGTLGELRVPGGLAPARRGAVREALAALRGLALADRGAAARLAAVAAGSPELIVPFAVEAGLECAVVSTPTGAAELVAALRAAGSDAALTAALHAAAARAVERGRRLSGGARERVGGLEDPDRLDAALAEAESGLDRQRAVLRAAGLPEDELDAAATDLRAAVVERREIVRSRLVAAVDRAARLPDEAIRRHLGELGRVARRAIAIEPRSASALALDSRVAGLRAAARRSLDGRLVVPLLPTSDAPGRAVVGGKAAGLARIATALPRGCRIPPGFVITTDAYRLHLLGGVGERLRELLARPGDGAAVSAGARAAILGATVPAAVTRAAVEGAARLGAARLAARSSSPFEDDAGASLAGVFDTDLGLRGPDELAGRIRSAWASAWSPRAVALLGERLRDGGGPAIAVVVQAMVDTHVGGILSTCEPGGATGLVLVNAWWGLGTGIGGGELAGDLYWLRRRGGAAVATDAGDAAVKIEVDPERCGTRTVDLADDERGRPCLDTPRLRRLAELARALEAVEGPDLEVEFGFDREETLHVFQCRRAARPRLGGQASDASGGTPPVE